MKPAVKAIVLSGLAFDEEHARLLGAGRQESVAEDLDSLVEGDLKIATGITCNSRASDRHAAVARRDMPLQVAKYKVFKGHSHSSRYLPEEGVRVRT